MVKLIKKIISMTGTTYSYLLNGSFDKLIIVGMNLWKLMIYRAIFQPDWRHRKQKHPIANIVYPMVKPVLVVVYYWVYHFRNVRSFRLLMFAAYPSNQLCLGASLWGWLELPYVWCPKPLNWFSCFYLHLGVSQNRGAPFFNEKPQ